MSVVVAIPVRRVSARAVIEKGRGWSALDEFVLWSLSREAMSASRLADDLDIPRRVILEIIVRMMRFRLLEAVLIGGFPAFQTTTFGAAVVAGGSEIPTDKQRISRNVSFVYDTITGTVFSRRDVAAKRAGVILSLRQKGVDVRDIEVRGALPKTTPQENFARIQEVLREDEKLLFFDGDTFVERQNEFMLVVVDGASMRNLPDRAPQSLKQEIVRIAASTDSARPIVVASHIQEEAEKVLPDPIAATFEIDGLVFGGDAHREIFRRILERAKRRMFLHSTFLRVAGFANWLDEIRDAVRRGVKIDLFWGAGAPDSPNEKAFLQAAEISKLIAADDVLRERVRIHLRSTGSHSKLIIADDGDEGYVAVVGSCNWLYTSFERFELSCEFRDPHLIAEIADGFGAMVARPGFKPEIGTELYILARALRRRPESTGNHRARVIAGQAHEAILREASGGAPSRFLVASDKFGNSAFANAIIPAEVAAATARTEPVVIYGSTAGLVSGPVAAGLTIDVRERGVRLLRIAEGFHAKFLLWGEDDIVVTSINWCSWTSPPDAPFGEIGVHISRPGLARYLAERLPLIWSQL
ncbi:phospholipase D-like domain-containing protein [Bradyrhizobium sp. ISRA442]|uniref:phospholipase D-like domain-containing protein n=1 Tax=Bradyrhizobium sp. ISRA442 TaxID=2866197 RepID=UPI00311B1471